MSKSATMGEEFSELLKACRDISSLYPEGLVYIGGIAVYLHAINHDQSQPLAEFTHDADFYISISDMADLRDREELVSNRRLNKHQLIKDGFEFDIYTERHSALVVPYDQVVSYSTTYEQLRVASLEHLAALKLDAYRDRRSSTKGGKDARDLIRIAVISEATGAAFNAELAAPYLTDEHLSLLDEIQRGAEFLVLTRGNAKQAKHMRGQFASVVSAIAKQYA